MAVIDLLLFYHGFCHHSKHFIDAFVVGSTTISLVVCVSISTSTSTIAVV